MFGRVGPLESSQITVYVAISVTNLCKYVRSSLSDGGGCGGLEPVPFS